MDDGLPNCGFMPHSNSLRVGKRGLSLLLSKRSENGALSGSLLLVYEKTWTIICGEKGRLPPCLEYREWDRRHPQLFNRCTHRTVPLSPEVAAGSLSIIISSRARRYCLLRERL